MTQTIDAPPRQPESRVQRARAWVFRKETLGLLVLALFVVFLGYGSFVGPRQAPDPPPPELRGGYVLTDSPPKRLHETGWATTTRADDLQPSTTGSVLVWRAAEDTTVRWARLSPQDPQLAQLRTAPSSTQAADPRVPLERVGQVGFALGAVAFLAIVAGPRPRHGTRWFWFWMLFAPLGLGAAWFAWTELVRTPAGRTPRRRSGFDGFVTMILVTIGVSVGFWLVAGL